MNSIPIDACAVIELLAGRPAVVRIPIPIDDAPVSEEDAAAMFCRQRGIPTHATEVRMCGSYLKCKSPKGSCIVSSRVETPKTNTNLLQNSYSASFPRVSIARNLTLPSGSAFEE